MRSPNVSTLEAFGTIQGLDGIRQEEIILMKATRFGMSGGGRENVPIKEESLSNPTLTCWQGGGDSPTRGMLPLV